MFYSSQFLVNDVNNFVEMNNFYIIKKHINIKSTVSDIIQTGQNKCYRSVKFIKISAYCDKLYFEISNNYGFKSTYHVHLEITQCIMRQVWKVITTRVHYFCILGGWGGWFKIP